jgi:hypothetical protein
MFCLKPLSLCEEFIEQLNSVIKEAYNRRLTLRQRIWLSICITGILVTNSVCWKRFERATVGNYCAGTLSKMFHRAKINWDILLQGSILHILNSYKIHYGVLALDDTANQRSKKTSKIDKAHKVKDKKTGGYFNGQEVVFLLLITEKVTIPVGFKFYAPQPSMSQWRKEDAQLKRQGIAPSSRPKKPAVDLNYPSNQELALDLLREFASHFPQIKIQCVLADALYGTKEFVQRATTLLKTQVISQIKCSQKIQDKGKYLRVDEYFKRNQGVPKQLTIRGGKQQGVSIHGARLFLKAHGCKRFIVALKYEGEEEYRYLVASELTWRLTDIANAYTMRWLVEVFIQDWKSYEGWCQLAKQQGVDGSSRGLILSLLTDHCLLLHPEQKALINRKLPALTVGSLRALECMNAIVESIEYLVTSEQSQSVVQELSQKIAEIIPLRQSAKHMSGRNLGRLEPSSSLKYKAA